MNFEDQYKIKQLEVRLSAQKTSLLECEVQILKHKAEIERYEITMKSLKDEITKTKLQLGIKEGGE